MKKIFILLSVILLLAGSVGVVSARVHHPHHPHRVEDCDHDGDALTDSLEHEETECQTPTPTETPTPSVTPDPCGLNCDNVLKPSPTATPSPAPEEGGSSPQPEGNSSTTNAPASATCTIPFAAPALNGFAVVGHGSVRFSWLESDNGVDKFSIRYGYSKDQLVFGQDNIPANEGSVTLNDLQPGAHVWAIVSSWKSGCAEDSNELDPLVR